MTKNVRNKSVTVNFSEDDLTKFSVGSLLQCHERTTYGSNSIQSFE